MKAVLYIALTTMGLGVITPASSQEDDLSYCNRILELGYFVRWDVMPDPLLLNFLETHAPEKKVIGELTEEERRFLLALPVGHDLLTHYVVNTSPEENLGAVLEEYEQGVRSELRPWELAKILMRPCN